MTPRPPAGPQDVQAVHRRRVPALGVRPHLPGPRRDGVLVAWAVQASRKDLRDAVRAARGAQPGGPARPRTSAARSSTASPR